MLKNLNSIPEAEGLDLSLLDEVDADIEELDGEIDATELDLTEGLDFEDSLGAVKRRRRRKSRRGRSSRRARAASRRAKSAPRTARGRFMKSKSRKGRRRKSRLGQEMLFGLGRRRRKGRKSRKGRKARARRRRASVHGLAGLSGLDGLGGDFGLDSMDEDGLGSVSSLGRKRRRKSRKGRKARARRRGRRGGRRRSMKGFADITGIAEMGGNLADAEVAGSMPVVGVFQWLATRPGLEAFGGVALGSIVNGLVKGGLFIGDKSLMKADKDNMLWQVASGLVSAVTIWEVGRLIGSGNIAKFGAFYAIGKLVEDTIINPFIMKQIGLGQDVLLPGIKRPDYAVNPLSGFGTVREPDTASIGDFSLGQARVFENQNLVGMGTVREPDTASIGTVRIPDSQMVGVGEGEEGEVGQYGEELSEESEVF